MQFDHFIIRPLEATDLDAYYALIDRNRSRLEASFAGTLSRTLTYADTEVYLAERLQQAAERCYLPFVLQDTVENRFAGFFDIKHIDWNIPKGELGCYADVAYAGKGVLSRAMAVFADHCFAALGFEKLFLRTHETNAAARRIVEKCGFRVEGLLRKDYRNMAGELKDLLYYGKLKDD